MLAMLSKIVVNSRERVVYGREGVGGVEELHDTAVEMAALP